MILIKLFLSFLRIGLFAVGGAYSFLPLLEREVVQKYNWLTREEFLEVLGMVKVFPGAISIKYATYTGYKIAGILGVVSANLGNLFAPIILLLFASALYTKYKDLPSVKASLDAVQLVVFALILAVAFEVVDVNRLVHLKSLIIITVSFALFIYTKIHPAIIIIVAGVIGAFLR